MEGWRCGFVGSRLAGLRGCRFGVGGAGLGLGFVVAVAVAVMWLGVGFGGMAGVGAD